MTQQYRVHVGTHVEESDEDVCGYVGYSESGRGMRQSGNENGDFIAPFNEAEKERKEWEASGWNATLVPVN